MSMVKLNVFHWHITDSPSFPLVLKSHPDLAKYGAYSEDQVYTSDDVQEVMNYGKLLGIRIVPEFDNPSHVGQGWQFKNLTTCLFAKPFNKFCSSSPPCGQLDPSKNEVYSVIEDIFRDFLEMFGDIDYFHMGGDEVSTVCWNTSAELQQWMLKKKFGLSEASFHNLWGYFLGKIVSRFDKANGAKPKIPIIVWTSSLTNEPFLTRYLDKDRFIIQVWSNGKDGSIQTILEKGYKIIVSNTDALYLDCGFSDSFQNRNNWCSPYKTWQRIYYNKMSSIAGKYVNQVLGAEAQLWTEQVDEVHLEERLWPRLSAMAERLWSDPNIDWKQALARLSMHRERLVENGIRAEQLTPTWCLHNEGDCFKT